MFKSLPKIVLASSSRYKMMILKKVLPVFETADPDIDETPYQNESPDQLVNRLSLSKANEVANWFPTKLVIGCDQIAVCREQDKSVIISKPHTEQKAIEQLTLFNGKQIEFLTSVTTIYNKKILTEIERFSVHFKHLSEKQIKSYITSDSPLDCAGSFKSEGLGILLFNKLEGRDPNALVGLPLILLNEMLTKQDIDLLDYQ